MKSSLKEYEVEDGYFNDVDGCHFDTAAELIQIGLLGYCFCGGPETHLLYIREGLSLIKARSDLRNIKSPALETAAKELAAKGSALYGNVGAMYAQYYWFDYVGFTQHGSTIPGILTPEGENMLNILNEWAEQQAKEEAAG